MTKKALLLHWIIFGIVGALALFLILVAQSVREQPALPGKWSFDFMQQAVWGTEQRQLVEEQYVRQAAWQVALELAAYGGFPAAPSCGSLGGIPLWNEQDRWDTCLPKIKENVFSLFAEKLKLYPPITYTSVDFSGSEFWALSKERLETVVEQPFYQKYTVPANTIVNLGYSFGEYTSLFQHSQQLVSTCRSSENLKSCLEQNKPDSWKFTSCMGERYPFDKRKVPFCVRGTSPVLNASFELQPVEYHFALDFTPLQPFVVQNVEVKTHPQGGTLTVSFDAVSAEKYTVYFIDTTYSRSLLAQDEFDWRFVPTTVVHGRAEFKSELLEACPPDLTLILPGSGYRCPEKIHLLVHHSALSPGKSFFVMVSATSNGQESVFNKDAEQVTMN